MATQHILPQANYKQLVGTVVSAGTRLRTIRVRLPNQTWNSRVHKFYNDPKYVLVHDPRRSCDIGDVISLRSNWRVSKHVKHVVTGIVSPFGRTMAERPPVMTEHERVLERAARRKAKDDRQAARGREPAIKRLKQNEKLAGIEAFDERGALKRVMRTRNDQRGCKLPEILVGENDLSEIRHRISEAIMLTSQETRQWALDDNILNILTLWLAVEHASRKHLYVGKELALRAGKPPTSAVIREAELMAAFMARRAITYRKHFDRLAADKPGKFPLTKTLERIRDRMMRVWQSRVFETNEPDSRKARQERKDVGKIGSDADVIQRQDEAWYAIIAATNKKMKIERQAEAEYWLAQRATMEAATAAVIASAGAAGAVTTKSASSPVLSEDTAAEADDEFNFEFDEEPLDGAPEAVAKGIEALSLGEATKT